MQSPKASESSPNQLKKLPSYGKVQSLEILYLQTLLCQYDNLFDYDQQHSRIKRIFLRDSAVLAITKEQKFCFLKTDFDKDQNTKNIIEKLKTIFFTLTIRQNYYLLQPVKHHLSKPVWLDIASFPSKLFPLRKHDIVKLGAKSLKIKQLITHDQKIPLEFKQQEITLQNFIKNNTLILIPFNKIFNSQQQIVCVKCKHQGQTINPLILPCQCQNNHAYFHLRCLQTIFKSHFQPKQNSFTSSLPWKHIICPNCRAKLKTDFQIGQKNIKIFTLPRPNPPYLIFQHQVSQKDASKSRYLQIVPMQNKKSLSIGHSPHAHVSFINERSVEEIHCQLIYDNETRKFLLIDLQSRFSTLLRINSCLKIRPHHKTIRVQVGNKAFDLTALRNKTNEKTPNFDQSHSLFEPQYPKLQDDDTHFFI